MMAEDYPSREEVDLIFDTQTDDDDKRAAAWHAYAASGRFQEDLEKAAELLQDSGMDGLVEFAGRSVEIRAAAAEAKIELAALPETPDKA